MGVPDLLLCVPLIRRDRPKVYMRQTKGLVPTVFSLHAMISKLTASQSRDPSRFVMNPLRPSSRQGMALIPWRQLR